MTAPKAKFTLTPEILQRFHAYNEKTGGEWGSLHIVLSGGNVEDHFVKGCITFAEERHDTEGKALAEILLQMSKSQRGRVSRKSARVMA